MTNAYVVYSSSEMNPATSHRAACCQKFLTRLIPLSAPGDFFHSSLPHLPVTTSPLVHDQMTVDTDSAEKYFNKLLQPPFLECLYQLFRAMCLWDRVYARRLVDPSQILRNQIGIDIQPFRSST